MKYQVLESFKVKTAHGELTIEPGKVITLPHDKAIQLINEGNITPIGRVAYKVYSEILQAYLWVTEDTEDMKVLRGQGITEAIYTGEEIEKLNGISKDDLRAIQSVKQAFEGAIVKEVDQKRETEGAS